MAKSFNIAYTHNTLGDMASMTYPDGATVAYAPNALGQASQVGSFVNGLTYFANGSIKHFNYGNGLKHVMLQNARLLPQPVQVGTATNASAILDTTLNFDANGNP